jgi:hypothetical protein
MITDEEQEIMTLRRQKPSPKMMTVVVSVLQSVGVKDLTNINPVE